MLVIKYNARVGFGSGTETSKKSSAEQDTFHTKPYHSLGPRPKTNPSVDSF